MAKIRPFGDRIVVKRVAAADKSAGGIIIPETAREKTNRGTVVAIGDGKPSSMLHGKLELMRVKVGDEVIFSSYTGTELRVENVDLIVMGQDDVLVIVEA